MGYFEEENNFSYLEWKLGKMNDCIWTHFGRLIFIRNLCNIQQTHVQKVGEGEQGMVVSAIRVLLIFKQQPASDSEVSFSESNNEVLSFLLAIIFPNLDEVLRNRIMQLSKASPINLCQLLINATAILLYFESKEINTTSPAANDNAQTLKILRYSV